MGPEPGSVAIVTGGASGLGRAVCEALRDAGTHVVALDRVAPPDDGEAVLVDLLDRRATEEAVLGVVARHGRLDAVVTAAGTDACGDLLDVPADDWERVVGVNLLGTVAVVRAALPALIESGGRVVTVASTLALRALPAATAYCASKFGVLGFSRALASETQGRVGVTTLVPGGMDTAFFDGRDPQFKPGPDAMLNDPADVAAAVVWALGAPPGCEVREMVVCPAREPSWP